MNQKIMKSIKLFLVLFAGAFLLLGSAGLGGLTANAGADRSITEGESVTLDASASTPDEGETLTGYKWSEGSTVYCENSKVCTIDNLSKGTHYISLIVTQSDGLTAGDSVKVEVKAPEPVNQAPTATPQSVTTDENTAKAITLTGTDPDGDSLTYTIVTNPQHGTLSGTVPNLTYTPDNTYSGSDSFTFRVNDGSADSAPATVNIMVNAVNHAPTAIPQSVTTDEDTAKTITLTGSDPDGDSLSYTIVTNPSHGTLSGSAPNVTYTPAANYSGSDSFTFRVNDGSVASAPVTVSIMVNAINHAPTATPQSVTTDEDTAKTITLAGTDPDGDSLSYIIVTNPSHGTLSGTAPNVTYTPDANYNGNDSFSFRVNDGTVDSTPATVTITVNSINDAPTVDAGADANITQGDSYTPTPTSSDSDGTIVSTVWKEGATTLTFPKTDFTVGEHILTVTVTDNDGATATDTLTLTVNCNPANIKPLPKTGQTTVYANFDDGYYQKGASVDPRFVRDDVTQTVKDNVTGLVWQDDEEVKTTKRNWQDAIDHCEALELGTFTDWRLPTIEELIYITDKGRVNPAIDPEFENVSSSYSYYWSSTPDVSYIDAAWLVGFNYGYNDYGYETYDLYVRCVRGGQ